MDYDNSAKLYQFSVRVNSSSSTIDIPCSINILPVNEYEPYFGSNITVSKSESLAITSLIYQYEAIDPDDDPHGITNYKIASVSNGGMNIFQIQPFTGEIMLTGILDYESVKNYELIVIASDGGQLSGTGTVSFLVTDVNDNMPLCNQVGLYVFVKENSPLGIICIH